LNLKKLVEKKLKMFITKFLIVWLSEEVERASRFE
jgi:hypothetical protein